MVTSLTMIIMLGTVSLFMTFLLNHVRVTRRQRIKNAGDNAIKQITRIMREAGSITNCESNTNTIEFMDLNNISGTYYLEDGESGGRIASNSSGTTYYLTPDDIAAGSFEASCHNIRDSYFVRFSFTLTDSNSIGFSSQTLTQTFSGSVNLRN